MDDNLSEMALAAAKDIIAIESFDYQTHGVNCEVIGFHAQQAVNCLSKTSTTSR